MLSTTSMLTDHYELTMVQAAMGSGTAFRRSVFELFPAGCPRDAATASSPAPAARWTPSSDSGSTTKPSPFLAGHQIVDDEVAQWLSGYRFTGDVWGYPDGELYFPGSPIMVVEGSFAEAVILETVLLSIFNYDSAVASAASRMTAMAGDRPCIEMGSRRTNEWSAVTAARAAYIAGFASTSNLEAGRTFGVPTAGTAAHSFTLLHDSEEDAFKAQIAALGTNTTLLVDTYDVAEAVTKGVELTNGRLGAVRLDSGDLLTQAVDVRRLLDSLGAVNTRIIVTSDLDEYQIAALRGPRERLRGGHHAGDRLGRTHLWVRLQARVAGRQRRPRRSPAARGQEVGEQGLHRRSQVGHATPGRQRHRRGRGDRRGRRASARPRRPHPAQAPRPRRRDHRTRTAVGRTRASLRLARRTAQCGLQDEQGLPRDRHGHAGRRGDQTFNPYAPEK
ncbi:MAG: hypothetical protein IPL36_03495 [Nigerium sp.]|nr:hypothetical protein [Nigerium sp.]